LLQALDITVFRFINLSLSNPLFDKLMPFASDTPFFAPILLVIFILLIWKGGVRGRICALMLILGLCVGDWVFCSTFKNAIGRLRPFNDIADTITRVGRGQSFSMPSSHAANWFSATMVAFIFYRRSIWFMLPLAVIVSFSRVYNGVHYPSDVLVGAILGAGYGAAIVWTLNSLWQFGGRRWFPLWWKKIPSLLRPEFSTAQSPIANPQSEIDKHWLRLGYFFIGVLLLIRLAYLAAGKIELSEDEAYQWLWSKHLALSYYSKPPLIAYTQFLGTSLWGDNEFGVRFFSPIIAAILSFLMLRFLAREVSVRVGLILVVILSVVPLTAVGATLMTIDPLSVLFWTAAMIAGWRAAQPDGTTRQWLWVGLWMGLGFLSKYTNLFQWLCWAFFFLLWPPARKHLRKPGPYLALFVNILCAVPVLIWNFQHHWITIKHVASDGKFGEAWHPRIFDFIFSEALLLHPVFFIGAIWAAILFWRRDRQNSLALFFFSMGAPLFIFYLLFSLHSRVLPNWIAPSVLPLFCLMLIYWRGRWPTQSQKIKPWLAFAIGFGIFAVIISHETNLLAKIIHRTLPPKIDLLHRVRGWKELAEIVGAAREKLQAEGKPAFIIGEHYGFTAQVSFYLPASKNSISQTPLVYFYATEHPQNQFFFWPNYLDRKGENAIFFREIDRPPLCDGWFWKWARGENNIFIHDTPPNPPVPAEVRAQFSSIKDLGVKDVVYRGNRVLRRVQLFECRDLQ